MNPLVFQSSKESILHQRGTSLQKNFVGFKACLFWFLNNTQILLYTFSLNSYIVLFILFLIFILISRYLNVPRSLFSAIMHSEWWANTPWWTSQPIFPTKMKRNVRTGLEAKGQVHALTYNFPVDHSTGCCLTSKYILADTFPSLAKYHIFPPIKYIAMHFFKTYLSTGWSMNILALKKYNSQKIVTTLLIFFFLFLALTAA